MRVAHILPLIGAVALFFPAFSSSSQPPVKKDKDKQATVDDTTFEESILRQAKLPIDGPSLLKYFREHTTKEVDPKQLALLIQQLGDVNFSVREKADKELFDLGPAALAVIKEAVNHADLEVRLRAIELRRRIEERVDPRVQSAIARLIGSKKPEGAAEVLLAFLPLAADDRVVEDMCQALAKVTTAAGKTDPAVVAALGDKVAVKRAAAGAALVTAGSKDHFDQVRGLLKDPVAPVRLRVALAFVASARDSAAVPALIQCLQDLPAEKCWQAEELLLRIAGEKAPSVALGTDKASCKICFDEWDKWWQDNRQTVDLAKIDLNTSLLGYTLVVFQNAAGAGKKIGYCVAELDAAKKVRWKFEVQGICDAQVIGPNRVLVVEHVGRRISERDFEGKVLWEKEIPVSPLLSAQRLSNGNTFVATRQALYEFNRKGEEVYSYARPIKSPGDIYRALKLRNGDIVVITLQGKVSWLDAKNKTEVEKFNVGNLNFLYGSIEELPNGNLLLPLYSQKKVIEVDRTGKVVWTLACDQIPFTAFRLPNGNTLVAFGSARRVVEYDRANREVWSCQTDGIVYAARKR